MSSEGWRCRSVTEFFLSMREALGSSPITKKKNHHPGKGKSSVRGYRIRKNSTQLSVAHSTHACSQQKAGKQQGPLVVSAGPCQGRAAGPPGAPDVLRHPCSLPPQPCNLLRGLEPVNTQPPAGPRLFRAHFCQLSEFFFFKPYCSQEICCLQSVHNICRAWFEKQLSRDV